MEYYLAFKNDGAYFHFLPWKEGHDILLIKQEVYKTV